MKFCRTTRVPDRRSGSEIAPERIGTYPLKGFRVESKGVRRHPIHTYKHMVGQHRVSEVHTRGIGEIVLTNLLQ
jgi:hypothetical protein